MPNSSGNDALLMVLDAQLEARLPTLATKADLDLLKTELKVEIRVAAAEHAYGGPR